MRTLVLIDEKGKFISTCCSLVTLCFWNWQAKWKIFSKDNKRLSFFVNKYLCIALKTKLLNCLITKETILPCGWVMPRFVMESVLILLYFLSIFGLIPRICHVSLYGLIRHESKIKQFFDIKRMFLVYTSWKFSFSNLIQYYWLILLK